MWWPLKSFVIISCETAKNTNICFIYAATEGSVTAFYTGPPEVTVILLGVLCTKKVALATTYLEVGDKKEAGNNVRLLCDKGRVQRSQKFIMDDTRLASVRGGHSGNRHGG